MVSRSRAAWWEEERGRGGEAGAGEWGRRGEGGMAWQGGGGAGGAGSGRVEGGTRAGGAAGPRGGGGAAEPTCASFADAYSRIIRFASASAALRSVMSRVTHTVPHAAAAAAASTRDLAVLPLEAEVADGGALVGRLGHPARPQRHVLRMDVDAAHAEELLRRVPRQADARRRDVGVLGVRRLRVDREHVDAAREHLGLHRRAAVPRRVRARLQSLVSSPPSRRIPTAAPPRAPRTRRAPRRRTRRSRRRGGRRSSARRRRRTCGRWRA